MRGCVRVGMLVSSWLACVPVAAGVFVPRVEQGVADEYLVVLAPAGRTPGQWANLLRVHGLDVRERWQHALHGFSVRLTEARARALAADARVQSVEQDTARALLDPGTTAAVGHCLEARSFFDLRPLPVSSPQTITCADPDAAEEPEPGTPSTPCLDNWGLDRIDQRTSRRDGRYAFSSMRAAQGPVYVFVLDTGIHRDHREFGDAHGHDRIVWGADATVSPVDERFDADITDCYPNGHGTHVAGIIAGRTYGVAKDARLVPVKVVGCGSALTSSAVRALDWIVAHKELRPAVINWSGANDPAYLDSLALREALRRVLDAGLIVVQSAGNQSGPRRTAWPADVQDACAWSWGGHFPEVIVVGGTDAHDRRWVASSNEPDYDCWRDSATLRLHGSCGSNVGQCIDLWAPAANVLSASHLSRVAYCRLSGTSMAAAHVSGVAALYLQQHPGASAREVARALREQGTEGVLQNAPDSPWSIGQQSPNLLLYSGGRQ
jgi:hypothetical protein